MFAVNCYCDVVLWYGTILYYKSVLARQRGMVGVVIFASVVDLGPGVAATSHNGRQQHRRDGAAIFTAVVTLLDSGGHGRKRE